MTSTTAPESPEHPTATDLALEAVASALSGAVLMLVLGLAGPAALVMVLGTERLENIELTLFGALLGLILGIPLGAWLMARSRRRPFSLTLAFGGTLLGAALALTIPTMLAGSAGATATPWIAGLTCMLGAVVFGNLKTWMGRES